MDHQKLIENLKQRHDFERWRDRNTLPENLFVWKFFLTGLELPDWTAQKIQRLEAVPTVARARAGELSEIAARDELNIAESPALRRSTWRRAEPQTEAVRRVQDMSLPSSNEGSTSALLSSRPPCVQSLWKQEHNTEALLSLNTFECPSRAMAHEFLLILLAEFQLPLIAQIEDTSVGDVAFSGGQDSMLMFARANLIHLVRNAGRLVIPVSSLAKNLDREVTAKPEIVEPTELRGLRARRVVEATPVVLEVPIGGSIPLDVEGLTEPPDALREARRMVSPRSLPEITEERRTMYKVFSTRNCDMYDENGKLMVRPQAQGEQNLTVYSIEPNRSAISSQVRVVASSVQ